jgi:cellulose synthase/poly-beta-1,6-N-acetylglucosamine synthase-like glycosyltransferase
MKTSYPADKLDIIVVDSGSVDRTFEIVTARFSGKVRMIHEERRNGKANAINLALEECRGDIVILTDGPTLYETNTIREIVDSFKDPSVGAVSVLYKIPNKDDNSTTSSEDLLWSHKDKVRVLESHVHSTSWLSGEACAFRRHIIARVDENSLADDSNIALQVISRGYRVVINENTHFIERSPSEKGDYFRVKARRALGGLQEILRFRRLLFNSNYGYFGTVIFPYRVFAEFVSPILSVVALGLAGAAVTEIGLTFGPYPFTIVTIVLLAVGLVLRRKLTAYITMQLIMLRALTLLLRRKMAVQWVQSNTTRSM